MTAVRLLPACLVHAVFGELKCGTQLANMRLDVRATTGNLHLSISRVGKGRMFGNKNGRWPYYNEVLRTAVAPSSWHKTLFTMIAKTKQSKLLADLFHTCCLRGWNLSWTVTNQRNNMVFDPITGLEKHLVTGDSECCYRRTVGGECAHLACEF